MLYDIIDNLICPHCRAPLAVHNKTVRCTNEHSFDIAKEGYVSLLVGDAETGTADTPNMVRAREAFLGAGHYQAIADTVCVAVGHEAEGVSGCIIDLGAGTGYYLARVLDALPDRPGIALDISKAALKRAARAHERIGVVGCDVWRDLPVRSGAAAAVLNIFSPRNPAEIRRVLAPDGVLALVSPTPQHLDPLVEQLGLVMVDERKQDRIEEKLSPFFALDRESVHEFTLGLHREELEAVICMGPSAWHTSVDDLRDRLRSMSDPTTVLVSVNLAIYRPLPEEPPSPEQVLTES